MSEISSPSWRLQFQSGCQVLTLSGDWIAQSGGIPSLGEASFAHGDALTFDTTRLGRWDTGLVEFLWDAKLAAAQAGLAIDSANLPDSARKLLDLLPAVLTAASLVPRTPFRPLDWTGARTIAFLTEIGVLAELLAETATGTVSAVRGRSRIRGTDLLGNIRDAGPSALMIVSVVNFLVGAILAFVGAAQLRKFAADAYVANLVGIALVRELAAIMTAIVMAGRTGGAYAARIATMEGNEEIDALKVIGIPISSYLVLPAVLALVVTMPFLYLYGCLIGLLGGFLVSISMLDVTPAGYLYQTLGAVPLSQFAFGFVKSMTFALLIGITSCHVGLKAGRSSADVGSAATRAVVTGIVGVIALDSLFAVMAEVVGF